MEQSTMFQQDTPQLSKQEAKIYSESVVYILNENQRRSNYFICFQTHFSLSPNLTRKLLEISTGYEYSIPFPLVNTEKNIIRGCLFIPNLIVLEVIIQRILDFPQFLHFFGFFFIFPISQSSLSIIILESLQERKATIIKMSSSLALHQNGHCVLHSTVKPFKASMIAQIHICSLHIYLQYSDCARKHFQLASKQ